MYQAATAEQQQQPGAGQRASGTLPAGSSAAIQVWPAGLYSWHTAAMRHTPLPVQLWEPVTAGL